MKNLINRKIEKDMSSNKSEIREKLEEGLLEEQLEEMIKLLIVYMPLMILCKLKIKELLMVLKEMVLFFVLVLIEEILKLLKCFKTLVYSILAFFLRENQFSVFNSEFSVLPKTFKRKEFSVIGIKFFKK